MDFLFVRFSECQCLRPPAADNTTRAQDTIREACAKTDQENLRNAWQGAEYRFDVARATRGSHNELH
jgi:thermostable 8-oxoguanine DNA glycosylase